MIINQFENTTNKKTVQMFETDKLCSVVGRLDLPPPPQYAYLKKNTKEGNVQVTFHSVDGEPGSLTPLLSQRCSIHGLLLCLFELINSRLKCVKNMLTNIAEFTQASPQRLCGWNSPSCLNAKVDLALGRMGDGVAAELHVHILHDHVSEGVA